MLGVDVVQLWRGWLLHALEGRVHHGASKLDRQTARPEATPDEEEEDGYEGEQEAVRELTTRRRPEPGAVSCV